MIIAVCVAIFVVVVFLLAIIFKSPKAKGRAGESFVSSYLQKIAERENGYLINDVIIPGDSGKTSQIDHVLFLKKGIFLIETKNYAGTIYGTHNQLEWTQVLAYGNTKNNFYNPVKQNVTHQFRLGKLIRYNRIYSIVVFVRADISNVYSPNVFSIRSMLDYITDSSFDNISEFDLKRYFDIVNQYKLNPIKNEREHVKDIYQAKKDLDHYICPRCGGKLVARKGKDGNYFLGCSNYPKCKFTKKTK